MHENHYTIFYTDDDADDQEFFREIVTSINAQHSIFTQNDGIELLEVLQNPPPTPNIVFLDLNMPKKSGYEVLKEIRDMHNGKNIPVVIFSTSNDEKIIEKTKTLGASMYITKPSSYKEFKQIINSVLSINWKKDMPLENQFVFTVN